MKNIIKISNGTTQTTYIDADKVDAIVVNEDTATFIINGTQIKASGLTEDIIDLSLNIWQDENATN